MEVKWFLVVIGAIFTIIIVGGIYFVALNISTQLFKQYQAEVNRSETNFNRSIVIHDFLFDNITELKSDLDPILNEVDNATELREKQDIHFNQTAQDFQTIKEIIDLKKQDHILLVYINKTLAEMNNSGKPIIINNGSPVPLNNITLE